MSRRKTPPESRKEKSLKRRLRANVEVLSEILELIKENKRWALLPMFFVLVVLSIFLSLAGGSSILPAIYALF